MINPKDVAMREIKHVQKSHFDVSFTAEETPFSALFSAIPSLLVVKFQTPAAYACHVNTEFLPEG
jgi:hypothetical protein